ncbi:MAG: TatD family hydrolase, partial [Candidatus Marinimicrobia bacterium]|nr:TatD family hydrolase [Candidatus Neomarinimicrobiota bacterium]
MENRDIPETGRWFDAHLHWQAEAWAGAADAAAVRARAAGVDGWCCCGTQPADWSAVAEWGRAFPGQVSAYGLHPWFLDQPPADWAAQLRARLVADPAAAVGEFGLDHGLASYDPAAQAQVFRIQWDLARELDRVAILHCRRAWQALDECLRAAPAPRRGFVLHAY